jgi:hypothetical protein
MVENRLQVAAASGYLKVEILIDKCLPVDIYALTLICKFLPVDIYALTLICKFLLVDIYTLMLICKCFPFSI